MAALDLLGRRSSLRLLWELRSGDRLSFRTLAARAQTNPSVLNARLKELRAAGIVDHEAGYGLTHLGRGLVEALTPLLDWSTTWSEALGGSVDP